MLILAVAFRVVRFAAVSFARRLVDASDLGLRILNVVVTVIVVTVIIPVVVVEFIVSIVDAMAIVLWRAVVVAMAAVVAAPIGFGSGLSIALVAVANGLNIVPVSKFLYIQRVQNL